MTTSTQQTSDLSVTHGATANDAQLVVQLGQLAQMMHVDLGQALLWEHRSEGLSYEAFEAAYPAASDEAVAILNVLKWYETIGTLVKQGLLNRDLVLDWVWVSGMWDLCRPIALAHRDQTGSGSMWENFEALAASQNG